MMVLYLFSSFFCLSQSPWRRITCWVICFHISLKRITKMIFLQFPTKTADIGFNHYRPQTKLQKGNVFTPVCDSVHGGGVHLPWQTNTHPPNRHPPVDTPTGRHPHGRHIPPPSEMVIAADGMHPTGLHSCSIQPALG